MEIVMLNHNFAREGTYWRCYHLARVLAARGHDVTLFTRHPTSRFRIHRRCEEGVTVVATPRGVLGRLHLGELGVLDIAPRILHVLRRRPDVLMAFGAQPDVAVPFFVSRRLGGARLHHADRDDLKRGALLETAFRGTRLEWWIPHGERWEREVPRRADAVTTISRWLERDTLAWGLDPDKVCFLPSGADVERIRPLPRDEARTRLGLPHEAPVCTYVTAGGGPEGNLLLPVIEQVAATHPEARFVFVGPSDPARRSVPAVLETGVVPADAVRWWLAAADVALLPYFDTDFNRARWPIKLGDYIAAARPVVACDIGELGRVVAEHGIGLLARPDMSGFAERVLELLSDRARAEAIGARARRVAEEHYDWRVLAERLESFLADRLTATSTT
ncbi:MAG: glycosyltransferase family 4 protein [Gaiellaceae bacterium]